uniref:Tuftelin-interacting protein 11 n=1 Tax=Otolemur garnettii TaxID=30611 RepID=H0XL48_OTOGA
CTAGHIDDDDDKRENFEITDWDLQNEFNPNQQRHWQIKEEATYGMWAERDLDDERPSFGGKWAHNYSAPVNFISGLTKEASEVAELVDSDDFPEDFGPKKLKMGGNFKPSQKGSAGGTKSFMDFGSWERYTKGIGQTLLQKMGYVPGGLGKNAQGIINLVEAKQRKGKGAVGAYVSECTTQSLQDFPVIDLEEAEEEFQKELSQWRKDPSGSNKPKYSYKTVKELKAKGRIGKKLTAPQKISQVKVIDMTGQEQKVYYNYSQISISHKHNIPDVRLPLPSQQPSQPSKEAKTPGFVLPELKHNLQLLIDLTEQEIIQNDRQLQYERDLVVNLSHELEKMFEVLEHEELVISNFSKVLEMVEECEWQMQSNCSNPLTLDKCRMFETLQDEYYEEYWMSDCMDLVVAIIVYPLMKEYFKGCTYSTEIIFKLKNLLKNNQFLSHGGQDLSADAFHRLIWEVWMPFVQNIVTRWQPRNCDPMVDLMNSWVHIIPMWILDNILDQLIFPMLQKEAENWNPLTDTIPIHSWVNPWLPLRQAQLEPPSSPNCSKLSSALQKWHPSNSPAKFILQPWKDFTPGSWQAFMVKNIEPKLGMYLSELVINPHQQHMDVFYWVIHWKGMIFVSGLVGLLEKHFFPKWLQVLCSWLSNSPNYEEITKWYMGWKSMIFYQVLAHSSIKDKFNEALDITNRVVSSNPGAQENIAYLTHTERSSTMQERREAENMAQRGIGVAASSVPMNMKDLIETQAEEHNILFMPVIRKWHKGKQLYTFGHTVICIDQGVVFVQGRRTWVPTCLQSLIDMAK